MDKVISIDQMLMARAKLRWSQSDLSREAGISVAQIANLESEKAKNPKMGTMEAIKSAFERQGLSFKEGGVFERQYQIRELRGQQGFWDFFDDVYETVRDQGGSIMVHNVDERLFVKWLGEKDPIYDERMGSLNNFTQKILIKEGDTNFAATFDTTEYRWSPKEEFSATPFYLYGDKLAMIMFSENDVSVLIIDHPAISDSYRNLFMGAWGRAMIPPKKEKNK